MLPTAPSNMPKHNSANSLRKNMPKNSFSNMSFTKPPNVMPSINKSVNTLHGSLSDLTTPVMDSVNEAMENTNSMMSVPVMIGIGILTVLLIIITIFRDQVAFAFQTLWNYIKNGYNPQPDPVPSDPAIDPNTAQNMLPASKEVFNIATDKFKYSDAEPLCKAYGAELATYDQVKDAWNKGADWCNYGWVKGQAAVYPTQQSTYNKLQMGPEDQKGACGIPGVNGGYFDNPDLRFGVNCYGNKPSKTNADYRAEQQQNDLTPDALEYDRKVRDYKQELNEIPVSPFNTAQWA